MVLDIENKVLDNKLFNKHGGIEVNQWSELIDRRSNNKGREMALT